MFGLKEDWISGSELLCSPQDTRLLLVFRYLVVFDDVGLH